MLSCLIGGAVVPGRVLRHRDPHRRPDVPARPVQDPRLHRRQPRQPCCRASPRWPMFVLIIWLQGIWLPQRGYSFESTPLWAGIFMLPMTVGFLVAGPVSGCCRTGTVPGRSPPAAWSSPRSASSGCCCCPSTSPTAVRGGVAAQRSRDGALRLAEPDGDHELAPRNRRGVGAGMSTTFQNSAMVLSIGIFFSLMVVGLAGSLPQAMAGRADGSRRERRPGAAVRGAAARVGAVRVAAGLQPDPVDPRVVDAGAPAGRDASYLTGAQLLPLSDLRAVPPGARRGLRVRDRRLPRRRGGVVAAWPKYVHVDATGAHRDRRRSAPGRDGRPRSPTRPAPTRPRPRCDEAGGRRGPRRCRDRRRSHHRRPWPPRCAPRSTPSRRGCASRPGRAASHRTRLSALAALAGAPEGLRAATSGADGRHRPDHDAARRRPRRGGLGAA